MHCRSLSNVLFQTSRPVTIHEGPFGQPPRTQRRDYGLVIGQVLWRMRFDLLLLIAMTVLVISNRVPELWFQSSAVIRILGIAVAIFIGFRNTQAIGRWWEARKLWGSIVNVSRNWHDNLHSLLTPQQLRSRRGQQLMRLQVAMVWQLNFELRNYWHRDLRGSGVRADRGGQRRRVQLLHAATRPLRHHRDQTQLQLDAQ